MALEKVLVVDDDPNICDVLRMYLENEGYSVILAYDGEEALVKFNALKPDIILLDVMLPTLDGWQVCREVRKKSSVPIIMITAKGDTFRILLTIVGTRNPAEYSLRVEKTICHDLVQMGFVPVTGYAAGIDITANLCALEADKPSIALMGCGLDVAYPKSHVNLKYEIAKHGLILSEFLPGTSPAPAIPQTASEPERVRTATPCAA